MYDSKKMQIADVFPLVVMSLLSITALFGMQVGNTSLAGISVFFGVVYFFIHKRRHNIPREASGLDFRSFCRTLRNKSIWLWILLPIGFDIIAIGMSKLIVPEYLSHIISRVDGVLSFDKLAILIPQLLIFALGEEIAWRALFQKLSAKYMPFTPALLLTSLLFAIGHAAEGSTTVVLYDLLFVFLNSAVYGLVFRKTDNAYVSTISHFLSNLFCSVIVIML